MPDVKLTPQEAAEVERLREDHSDQQPYASELDDRELERAHKERRPVDPKRDTPGQDRQSSRAQGQGDRQ